MTVQFCGAISGRVTRRVGESDEQAIERAEATILRVLDRYAKRLNLNVDLEPDNTPAVEVS